MKLAVMQPYLFPYIGYFQLLNAVDLFVAYDDVQFIKDGWINRNRIMANGQSKTFTVPLAKTAHTDLICNRLLASDRWNRERGKLLTTITQNYGKAPYFQDAINVIEPCIFFETNRLIDFILNALRECSDYLSINTELTLSSRNSIGNDLQGEDRVIAIVKALGADHYINAIGGTELYDQSSFASQGIQLSFLKPGNIHYTQFRNEFIPWLSIIDVMMFNSRERIQEYLDMYELVQS